ncbi:hypothetical protein [Algoriphagus sp. Y33]|uniref:hypothetical protein n=1 Tax=Algoriphagus sp. Y33 TaxID=2772483 RepID=UPI001786BB71|nr:hypothetical protein [Algoriphagus sp. Y33]
MKKKAVSLFALFAMLTLLLSCKAYRNPANLKPNYAIECPGLGDTLPGLQNLFLGDQIKVVGTNNQVSKLIYCGIEQGYLVIGGRMMVTS